MESGLTPGELRARLEPIEDRWDQLKAAAELVGNGRIALGTSGQLSGTAIIDGAHRNGIDLRIFTVDTLRLFPETLEYIDTVEKHYGISIERVYPDQDELARMINRHGVFLFFDSKGKQEYCCETRKVRPNYLALADVDVWVTGLRRDQSQFRANTPRVSIARIPDLNDQDEAKRDIVKLAPLVDWSESDVRSFLAESGAPIHPLLQESGQPEDSEWFFESLGCVICTTRQARWEKPRSGRWRWFNNDDAEQKECGIHLPPPSHVNEDLDKVPG